MIIVPIEPRWFDQKVRIHAHATKQTIAHHGAATPELTHERAVHMARRQYEQPDRLTMVALDGDGADGRVIGYSELRLSPSHDGGPGSAELTDLVVDEDYRRRGVGRALFDACSGMLGDGRLATRVHHANTSAIAFCQRLGFRDSGRCHDATSREFEMTLA
ncbi:GNAT family N-acetyltransferase [Bifidobacterium pullorum subsp. saeculare]|uniref:GNAT family N-acetyltransferase n=1 Tax=Bifidobacterium pullorum subsp. saeculare TaxID=78257 RepID=A0A938WX78_9BIFI|nr:N-acetyltransferase [Bifidobacterium pullorum]MBM6699506.1 GNAT family N-acetyltransferase [Bifidobacterium pullorum subsp. saeculare]